MKNKDEVINLMKIYLNCFPFKRILTIICPILAVVSIAVCSYLLNFRNYEIKNVTQIIVLMHSPLSNGDLLFLLNWAFPQLLLAYICGVFLDSKLNDEYVLIRIKKRKNDIYARGLSLSTFCLIYYSYILAINLIAGLLLAKGISHDNLFLSTIYLGAALFFSSLSFCFFQILLSYLCSNTKVAFVLTAIVIILNGFVRFPRFLYFLGATTILRYYSIYNPMKAEFGLHYSLLTNIFFIVLYIAVVIKINERKDFLDKRMEDRS